MGRAVAQGVSPGGFFDRRWPGQILKLTSMARAAAPTTTAAPTRETARGFGGRAASVRRAEHGKLDGVALARTIWAGNLLRFVEDDLLEAGLAIFANVFVNGHLVPFGSI